MPTLRERVEGGIIGLLVGDALGVPYEFHEPEQIPPPEQIEYAPPAGFDRAHRGVPPGAWSDDGAQALCLLASLLDRGRFDAADFGRRLLDWYERGYLAVDGKVFDVGITTGAALRRLRSGVPALEAGPAEENTQGNGSLMRVLPLALWHRGADADLVADARAQSRVTHGHLTAQMCCAQYCLWARGVLRDVAEPWEAAVSTLRELFPLGTEEREALDERIRPDEPPHGEGSGYVVDCLRSARLAQSAGGFEAVARFAIRLGHDTDTTACVAGGIAGLRAGVADIPERWRDGLRGKELVEPLLARLCGALSC